MRFDKQAEVVALQRVPDGLGGWEESWVTIKTIDCFIAPVSADLQLKQYGFITNKALKLLTREAIPDDQECRVSIDGGQYRILQNHQHKRVTVLMLELVQ